MNEWIISTAIVILGIIVVSASVFTLKKYETLRKIATIIFNIVIYVISFLMLVSAVCNTFYGVME